MTDVDLFSGAGGWCEGVAELGIHPLGIELNADAYATRMAAGHRTLQADVAALDPADFAPCEILIGSPPCPTFSSAGDGYGHLVHEIIIRCGRDLARGVDLRAEARAHAFGAILPEVMAVERTRAAKRQREPDVAKAERKARRDADMSLLVVEPLRWAVVLRPTYIALEQVPGVLPLWQAFAVLLRQLGYSAWAGVLSAERYGVPQTRQRAILMASLAGPVTPPAPTHQEYEPGVPAAEQHTLEGTLLPWVSMAEALGWGMTERPVTTVMARGEGHTDALDGGAHGRQLRERERERGAWASGWREVAG